MTLVGVTEADGAGVEKQEKDEADSANKLGLEMLTCNVFIVDCILSTRRRCEKTRLYLERERGVKMRSSGGGGM